MTKVTVILKSGVANSVDSPLDREVLKDTMRRLFRRRWWFSSRKDYLTLSDEHMTTVIPKDSIDCIKLEDGE